MKLGALHSSERAIYQRRANEDRLSALNGKLRQEFHEKEFARWENKGTGILQGKQQRAMLQQLRTQAQRQLAQRRQRLAQLLQEEDEWCKQQIIELEETPEKVREKMAQRVKQLKAEREADKQAFVDTMREKQFESNADELRKVDAELLELKTGLERNLQVIERQSGLVAEYEENMLYAEMDRRDIRKKALEEQAALERAREKEQERNAILKVQLELKGQKQTAEREKEQREKQMLRDQWQKEKAEAEVLKDVKAEQNKALVAQIAKANESQREEKMQLAAAERAADKDMIDRIVAKEKELQELERLMKEQQK